MKTIKLLVVLLMLCAVGCQQKTLQRTPVVVVWIGRLADVSPEVNFQTKLAPAEGFEGSAFGLSTDEESMFRVLVQSKMATIMEDLIPKDVSFVQGQAKDYPRSTKLYITMTPYRKGVVGVAGIDAGNMKVGTDTAFVLCDALLALSGLNPTLDGWANAIANTGAHELCHTLGFGHTGLDVEQTELMRPSRTGRALLLPHTIHSEFNTTRDGTLPGMQEYDVRDPRKSVGTMRRTTSNSPMFGCETPGR